jgi:hypothetical protein
VAGGSTERLRTVQFPKEKVQLVSTRGRASLRGRGVQRAGKTPREQAQRIKYGGRVLVGEVFLALDMCLMAMVI